MGQPERFDDTVHEQFSVADQESQSSVTAFPLLNPEGRSAALAVQLQMDAKHGTVSSITHSQILYKSSRLADCAAELSKLRLDVFSCFYNDVCKLLKDPGDDPEPGILYVGPQQLFVAHPGEHADPIRLIWWAVYAGCRRSLDAIDEMRDIGQDAQDNLRGLVNEACVMYLMEPDDNFQELLA